MKKYLLTNLLLSITFFSIGQQYHPLLENTEWYFGRACPWFGYSSSWVQLNGDTIINGVPYKKYNQITSNFYVREDTLQKKVWLYTNSQDVLLYDFNLTIGDTFIFNNTLIPADSFIVIMDDSLSTCAGQRRRLKLNPLTGQYSQPAPFECVEGVGSLYFTFGLYYRGSPPDNCGSFLICSHQNGLVTYDSSFVSPDTIINCPEVCSIQSSVSEQNILNINSLWGISPNPFSTQTILSADASLKNAILTVKNILGEQVKQIKNISGQKINFSRDYLPSGLYFVQLTQDNKVIATEKIVITD